MMEHTCSRRESRGRGRRIKIQKSRIKRPTWDLALKKPKNNEASSTNVLCLMTGKYAGVSNVIHSLQLVPTTIMQHSMVHRKLFFVRVVLCCHQWYCNGCHCTLQVLPESLCLFVPLPLPHSSLFPFRSQSHVLLSDSFAHCLMKLWSF